MNADISRWAVLLMSFVSLLPLLAAQQQHDISANLEIITGIGGDKYTGVQARHRSLCVAQNLW